MHAIVLVQKPLDILNALEYFYLKNIRHEDASWVVIGASKRQQTAIACLKANGLESQVVIGPDLLMHDALFSRISSQAPALRRTLQGIFSPLAFLHWHISVLVQLRQLRTFRHADLLVYDAWRTKLVTLLALPRAKHCITDGGYSTETYGLIRSFETGGAIALVDDSLRQQKRHFPVPWLRRSALKRVDRGGTFFSAYWPDKIAVDNAVCNKYQYFRSRLAARKAANLVMVLGYADFRLALESCTFALDWVVRTTPAIPRSDYTVVYRPHPVDVARKHPDEFTALRTQLAAALDVNLEIGLPEFGLEFDLLNAAKAPQLIFGYRSSAKIVIEKSESIPWIDLPFSFHPEEIAVRNAPPTVSTDAASA